MAKTKITLGSMGLTDANADRLLFWDDSAGAIAQLTASTNVTISGTNVTAAGGGDLTPSFCAKLSSNQSFTDDTATLAALATELWDTDSAFTNTASNYKFTVPTGEGGNYCFWAATNIGALGDGEEIQLLFYKNGSNDAVGNTRVWSAASGVGVYINAMFFKVLAEDDYMQLYISASDGNHFDASMTQFGGFKLLGT